MLKNVEKSKKSKKASKEREKSIHYWKNNMSTFMMFKSEGKIDF